MSQNINLKEIEQKAWTSYFHDGLWDICWGFILLGVGLSMIMVQMYVMLACFALAIASLFVKKRLARSRMGHVRFSSERTAKTKRANIIAPITIAVLVVLVFVPIWSVSSNMPSSGLNAWLSNYHLVLVGAILAALLILTAYMVEVKRYYIYATVILIAFYIAQLLISYSGIPVAATGGVILLIGLVVLTRFLRKYPKPPKELAHSDD